MYLHECLIFLWYKLQLAKYTIHGCYGIACWLVVCWSVWVHIQCLTISYSLPDFWTPLCPRCPQFPFKNPLRLTWAMKNTWLFKVYRPGMKNYLVMWCYVGITINHEIRISIKQPGWLMESIRDPGFFFHGSHGTVEKVPLERSAPSISLQTPRKIHLQKIHPEV